MSKKGIKCYFDDSVLSLNEREFFWEHHFDINALWQENKERFSNVEAARNGAVKSTSILEQKIKELEAENAELKNRANAFTYNGVASQENDVTGTNAFNDNNAELAEENRKLSEAKASLQNKNMELYKQVQDLQQRLSQNGGNRMSEEVTQWEYKTVNEFYSEDNNIEKELNKLGTEGWEATGNRVERSGGHGCGKILLKRPKKTQDFDFGYSR